jgi:hypothetical protein
VCLLAYLVIAVALEPLMVIGDMGELLVGLAWLFPVVVGGVLLPSRGLWLPGLGCWSVLFSVVTALSFNAYNRTAGMAFWWRWLE